MTRSVKRKMEEVVHMQLVGENHYEVKWMLNYILFVMIYCWKHAHETMILMWDNIDGEITMMVKVQYIGSHIDEITMILKSSW